MDTVKLLLGLVALIASVWAWWSSGEADRKAKREALKKEADDAVNSGSDSGITRVFDELQ